jgi:hypothetical protein
MCHALVDSSSRDNTIFRRSAVIRAALRPCMYVMELPACCSFISLSASINSPGKEALVLVGGGGVWIQFYGLILCVLPCIYGIRLTSRLWNVGDDEEENCKVVQIWPGRFVCKQVTVCPGPLWTTLYISSIILRGWGGWSLLPLRSAVRGDWSSLSTNTTGLSR